MDLHAILPISDFETLAGINFRSLMHARSTTICKSSSHFFIRGDDPGPTSRMAGRQTKTQQNGRLLDTDRHNASRFLQRVYDAKCFTLCSKVPQHPLRHFSTFHGASLQITGKTGLLWLGTQHHATDPQFGVAALVTQQRHMQTLLHTVKTCSNMENAETNSVVVNPQQTKMARLQMQACTSSHHGSRKHKVNRCEQCHLWANEQPHPQGWYSQTTPVDSRSGARIGFCSPIRENMRFTARHSGPQ